MSETRYFRFCHAIGRLTPLRSPWLTILLCLLLFAQGMQSRSLWASHEARAAQNAQTMLQDGTWLTPRLFDGQIELQKPPAFYWLVAAASWPTGEVTPFTVRLPSLLAGLITVLLVQWHLQQRGRPVAGFIAAMMLATAVHFTGTARIGRIDVPLTCVVTSMLLMARQALRFDTPSRSASASRLTVAGIGLLGGLALLLKGPIGLVLPAATLGTFALVERLPLRRLIVPTLAASAIALAVALPWYLYMNAVTDGEFFRVFILYHHFNRAFGGAEALAGHPWYYYGYRFTADFLPWSPIVIVALIARKWRGDADARFGLIWFTVMLVVLSLSRFKRADYLLPAYPGTAILLGCVCETWWLKQHTHLRRRWAFSFLAFVALIPAAWFVFDRVDGQEAKRDTGPFAQQVRQHTAGEMILFRVESHLLAFHLGRPVHTLVEWADLDSWLRQPGPHFVITRAEFVEDVRHHAAFPFEVIARDDRLQRPLILLRFPGEPCPTPPTD